VLVAVTSLLGYWAIMTWMPVPGVGAGALTPDGNLVAFVDRSILGHHLAYHTWDPEGLLSTIPALASALCGVFAGDWLNRDGRIEHRTLWLAAAGIAAALSGWLWGLVFAINKNLWTSS